MREVACADDIDAFELAPLVEPGKRAVFARRPRVMRMNMQINDEFHHFSLAIKPPEASIPL